MEETKLVESLEQSHLPTRIFIMQFFKDKNVRNAGIGLVSVNKRSNFDSTII